MASTQRDGWAIKFDSTNRLDGHREYFAGRADWEIPEASGYRTMVFETRRQARDFIKERYSYVANRPDLRREPHCWRVPKPVRVSVTVTEAKG